MAVFKDEDEVYTFLAGIFRRGLEKEGLADKLVNSGVVLRVHYTDPDKAATQAKGSEVLVRRAQGVAAGLGGLGWAVREVSGCFDAAAA